MNSKQWQNQAQDCSYKITRAIRLVVAIADHDTDVAETRPNKSHNHNSIHVVVHTDISQVKSKPGRKAVNFPVA